MLEGGHREEMVSRGDLKDMRSHGYLEEEHSEKQQRGVQGPDTEAHLRCSGAVRHLTQLEPSRAGAGADYIGCLVSW